MKLINAIQFILLLSFFQLHHSHAEGSTDDVNDLYTFHEDDVKFLETFMLSALPPIENDLSKKLSIKAVALGHQLFFDKILSDKNQFSCASCHQPMHYFTDNKPLAEAFGVSKRNTPTIIGSGYSPWFYWDGRKDSLWSQALEPIEAPLEMRADRASVVQRVLNKYQQQYEAIFNVQIDMQAINALRSPASPVGHKRAKENWMRLSDSQQNKINQHFRNIGKLLMAYQQQLIPRESQFDRFIGALSSQAEFAALKELYSPGAVAGLRLFMGKANCAGCHNGPLFTNYEFHNIGAPERDQEEVDLGRYKGAKDLAADEFNCLSALEEQQEEACPEIAYLKTEGKELIGAFKTPSLRNIYHTSPYMQAGQFSTLEDVVKHYNKPKPPFFNPDQHPSRPHFDIFPLGLTVLQELQVVEFLKTLTSIPLKERDELYYAPIPMSDNLDK